MSQMLHGKSATARPAAPWAALAKAIRLRLRGPGGLYNLGNLIALGTGLALQIAAASGRDDATPAGIVTAYFFGSPGASWLTLAIAIFLVSGEIYHRAWLNGAPPDRRLNRLADLTSFLGAAALTVSLLYFGDLLLALVSGLLLAGGKLGTALMPERPGTGRANRWPLLCRWAVLVSRPPAMIALAIQIARQWDTGSIVGPVVMLGCYAIWMRADLMFFTPRRSAGRQRRA